MSGALSYQRIFFYADYCTACPSCCALRASSSGRSRAAFWWRAVQLFVAHGPGLGMCVACKRRRAVACRLVQMSVTIGGVSGYDFRGNQTGEVG
jgi:hypothetical protein